MEISFSQSFLDNLRRIDNKVVIDGFAIDSGNIQTSFQVVCHEKKVQICVESVSGECDRLDFYCGGEIGFTITGEGIIMNPERTIFEFNLPEEPKAIIECPGITEDTKFLESIGTDLGNSLYKDIPVSSESLVWKETLGKYIVDRGLQDNHLYDVELLDTKSGVLEERPIKFKSYQSIRIEQGNWDIETVKKSVVVKHDVYTEISDESFLVWDSPMIDAKVNLEEKPNCINRIGEYVDPGEVIFGGTDCFQFTNYTSSGLVGFKITGTEGSKIEVLFNRESSGGSFTSFSGVIGEDGEVEIRFSDLPYLHFNGIRAISPSRVTGIETIMYLEEVVDEYSPNPDKTYVVRLNNTECYININGVCDYIEYEKYLGEIKEIGRGKEHIDSIPNIIIKSIDSGNLDYEILSSEKQILVKQNDGIGAEIYHNIFQVAIDNNIVVNGNVITTSPLYSDYKIKIEQTGIIWKIYNSPDYINGEDSYGIFLFSHENKSTRQINILTNDPRSEFPNSLRAIQSSIGQEIFKISIEYGDRVIDGDWWGVYTVTIKTLSENTGNTWRPKMTGTENPCLITFKFLETDIPSISLYAIQLKEIDNQIKVWEETLIPGQFSKVNSNITLLNTMTKNFIVAKTGGDNVESLNWYYYDLLGSNQFYVTDQNYQTTNVGLEYLVAPETTLLDLGTGSLRSTFGRVINVNRSNIIGSIGTLIVTESSAFPRSWRDLIDNNTANVEIERALDNIYIQVGPSVDKLRNEDYEVELDSISTFSISVTSNFKYVIQAYGYLRIYPESDFSGEKPSSYLLERVEEFSEYNKIKNYTFALTKLDEDNEMEDSYIEVRSGSLVRKISVKVVGPKKEHDYITNITKPNIIRIFENGTIATTNEEFLYKSSTTPKIEISSGVKFSNTSESYFKSSGYAYHRSSGTISVPNSRSLSYSKYPMKSFGYIREMSQDFSDSEKLISTDTTSHIDYPLYMKGKEHYLWCVDNLVSFSSITDPTSLDTPPYDMVLDANEGSGKLIYVVSRYDISNRTFITEYPEETNFKIKRDKLEAEITISPQQNIGLDERSQIEYAIPIQVKCNVENNQGNIYLGSLEYKATTKITDDSLNDVIEVDSNITELEGINTQYIKDNITSDKTQNVSIRIFQLGTDNDAFSFYTVIPDLGIEETENYIIPEIGNNYTVTSLEVSKQSDASEPQADICYVDSSYDPKYFLVKVTSSNRISNVFGYWYKANNLPMYLIEDTSYVLTVKVGLSYKGGESEEKIYPFGFKKYGCNYGFYVDGNAGFGNMPEEEYSIWDHPRVEVSNEGGEITIHAGIFYAVNGIDTTEALVVPFEYKFIGENKPIDFSWTNGNLDDNGNLRIVLPPRTRDEEGDKEYVLQVTQPHEYYPINLYVVFYQSSLRGEGEDLDTGKEDYKLMFLDDEVNILSNGTVAKDDDKFYFVSNLPESDFEKVEFGWKMRDPNEGNIPEIDGLNVLEEVERSYKNGQGYVKFKFKPNGVNVFIDALLYAKFTETNLEIGSINVKQGYFSLMAKYCSPYTEYEVITVEQSFNYKTPDNPMSRLSPSTYSYLYSFTRQHSYLEVSTSKTPCKSNEDNANSQKYMGRGVFKLTCQKKEYYDEEAEVEDLNTIFKDSIIEYISPKHVLDSYGIKFITESVDDFDAKVNTRFNNSGYATDKRFSQYCPYIELSYSVKEEYLRSDKYIIASGKITLRHPDSGEFVDFYILFNNFCIGSDEPQNIGLLKFSADTLNFDYRGGTKQVSFSPASFGNMMSISQMVGSNWISVNGPGSSNYLVITASENKTTESDLAFFRTGQLKIDINDPRDNYILGSYYINTNQEPDIAQTSGGSGGETGDAVEIELTLQNDRSSDIELTGEILLMTTTSSDTVWLSASLPGTNPKANNFTVPANSSSFKYKINCTGYSGTTNPNDCIGHPILACTVNYYDTSTGQSSFTALNPYIITKDDGGNLTFEKNGSYTITFTDNV